jgi:hypothetical protein
MARHYFERSRLIAHTRDSSRENERPTVPQRAN